MIILRNFSNLLMRMSLLVSTAFFLSYCSEVINLLNQANIQEPNVDITNVRMTGLSFEKVDLLFNININNPNGVGINLAGFDYDLKIEESSFINGKQDNGIAIKANGTEIVQLPLSLNFLDIYNTFSKVKNLDSVQYNLNTGLSFNLPVLGNIRIPISKTGFVPTLKLPSISLDKLKMDKIGFSGADLTLEIKLDNPNAVSFILKNMNYQLNIGGNEWIKGKTSQPVNLSAKTENIIKVPISLNFLSMGQSAYNILTRDRTLDYNLSGNADLGSTLSLLGDFNIPFNQSGKTKIYK